MVSSRSFICPVMAVLLIAHAKDLTRPDPSRWARLEGTR